MHLGLDVSKLFKFTLLACLLTATLAGTGMAQTATARLEGLVKDTTGGVIPGVTVVAVNQATNISFTSISGDSGRYVFVTLEAGAYDYIVKPFDLDYLEMCLLTKVLVLSA